ncbi:MAG TPA: S24 family peptidase [Chthoniobacteraceae bacterium]|jgi:SOS-response transcriptional repressor LexA
MSSRLINQRIRRAIRERKLLGVARSKGSTLIKPHILYETKAGVVQVSGAYVSGYTSHPAKSPWRQYSVPEIRSVEVLDDHFESAEPDYNPESSRYHRVLCALSTEQSAATANLLRAEFTSHPQRLFGTQDFQVVAPHPSLTRYDTIYGSVPAGPVRPEEQGDLGRLVMDLSAVGIPTTDKTFALRVEGESMSGAGINDGDILVLERREARSGDIVAALIDGQVTLKRYVITNKGETQLRAENPSHADIVELEGLQVQGVAIGLIRKL